jgi:hypothetical protein
MLFSSVTALPAASITKLVHVQLFKLPHNSILAIPAFSNLNRIIALFPGGTFLDCI